MKIALKSYADSSSKSRKAEFKKPAALKGPLGAQKGEKYKKYKKNKNPDPSKQAKNEVWAKKGLRILLNQIFLRNFYYPAVDLDNFEKFFFLRFLDLFLDTANDAK